MLHVSFGGEKVWNILEPNLIPFCRSSEQVLGHGSVPLELARFHTTCSLSNPVLISHKHACFITKSKWIRTFGITSGWVLQQKTDEAKLCITSWYVQCSKEAKNLPRMRWWSFQRAPNNGQQNKNMYTPWDYNTLWKMVVGRWTFLLGPGILSGAGSI